ncbi:hypothetical protein EB796_006422 [Bugula neritina]|uniref:Uncharacterized protein n=1 Tax=Bugula neritina TaxID=10212 RepID=A0A7J7K9F6_BUGNE|nr:hypothetical protein EB796_006422 [Bugula neritina]
MKKSYILKGKDKNEMFTCVAGVHRATAVIAYADTLTVVIVYASTATAVIVTDDTSTVTFRTPRVTFSWIFF